MSCMAELNKIIDRPFKQYERETVEKCYLVEIERHEGFGCFQIQDVMRFLDHFDSTIRRRVENSILLSINGTIMFSKHRSKGSIFIIAQGRSEGDFSWIADIVDCPNVNNVEIQKWETWENREFFSMARRKLCQCEGVFGQHIFVETPNV